MLIKNRFSLLSLLGALLIVGCSVGEAPSGSEQAVKDQFNAMKPEDKIKFIQGSPMPEAEKRQKIDEIKKQAGISGDVPTSNGLVPHG